jgi:hypothetical protein
MEATLAESKVDLVALQRKVDYLYDRQQILDCVYRYARGIDRHDPDIVLKAYHPDALDEHGDVVNEISKFAEWANALHDERFGLHLHNITTHNCEIEGDIAHAESYVLFGLALADGTEVWFGGGRYLDRLEKRNEEWKIALRRTMVDWMFAGDAYPFKTEYYLNQGYPKGTHDKTDISYLRPLVLGRDQKK